MDGVRAALLAGEVGGRGAGIEHHLILLAAHRIHRERNRGGRHIDDGIDPILVEPLPGDASADIGLVLVVGENHLDLHIPPSGEFLHRLAHTDHPGRAGIVAIGAGLIIQYAEAEDGGGLRPRSRWYQAREREPADHAASCQGHYLGLPVFAIAARMAGIGG